MHERILRYIHDITRYMASFYRDEIKNRAIFYAQRIRNNPLLEGREPLSTASVLVYLASKEFHVERVANYIHDETGVSRSYLSLHYREYRDLINTLN